MKNTTTQKTKPIIHCSHWMHRWFIVLEHFAITLWFAPSNMPEYTIILAPPPPSSPLVIRQRFQPFVPFAPQRWDILKQPTIFPQDDSAAVTISVTNSSESGSSTNVSKPPTYSSATEHEAYENTAFEKEEEKTQFWFEELIKQYTKKKER